MIRLKFLPVDASVDANEINIHTRIVEEFEDGHGLRKTKWNKNVFLVGVTLLHELVHWADNLDGIDFPDEEANSSRPTPMER